MSDQSIDLTGMVTLTRARAEIGLPVAASTLGWWARTGRVPAVRVGRRWFVSLDSLRTAVVQGQPR